MTGPPCGSGSAAAGPLPCDWAVHSSGRASFPTRAILVWHVSYAMWADSLKWRQMCVLLHSLLLVCCSLPRLCPGGHGRAPSPSFSMRCDAMPLPPHDMLCASPPRHNVFELECPWPESFLQALWNTPSTLLFFECPPSLLSGFLPGRADH